MREKPRPGRRPTGSASGPLFSPWYREGGLGVAQWDRIEVDGSPMRLYVEMPSIGRTFAAVIVVHHGGGVDRFIEDRVENLEIGRAHV